MRERVWDRFLTESDKAHLAATSPKRPYGFGQRAAVLSVDNYRGAVGDRPEPLLEAVQTWPNSTGLAGWEALERIAKLFAAARSAGIPIIHATGLAAEDSGMAGWSARRGQRGAIGQDAAARERHSRRYDIVDQAAPLPGEVVLRKTAPSAFFGTPLTAHLISTGVDTLIVCGEAVSGCVRATVVDGCSNRLHMIVVEDCVYDRHEASRAINLFDMDQKYGDVISLVEVLSWIDGRAGSQDHGSGDEIPDAAIAALPDHAVPISIGQHPIHGHVLDRAGTAAVDAAAEAMARDFGDTPHIIVPVRLEDVQHQAGFRELLERTEGGVLLVGVGYAIPAQERGSAAADDSCPDDSCPECGSDGARMDTVDAQAGKARVRVCDDCGAAWDP